MLVESGGTQTAIIGQEHTLAQPAVLNKTRTLHVSLANLASGETVELRVYGSVLSGGANELIEMISYTGVVTKSHSQAYPFDLAWGATFTLKQISGTGRAFPWEIHTLD